MPPIPSQKLISDRSTRAASRGVPAAWPLLAGLTLLLLTLAVSVTPITNNDIWLHMSTGQWILQHGRVPLADPFSFSAHGHRFHAHEWLAGVIFELVNRGAGVTGLIWLKTSLGGLALLLCAVTARREGASWPSTFGCTWLVLAIVNSRFLVRPEMFSYAFTALYLAVLVAEHRHLRQLPEPSRRAGLRGKTARLTRGSLLWSLVPIQWVWTQLHGYFLTGLAMVGLFLGLSLAERLWRPPVKGPGLSRLLSGCVALLTMLLLGCLNPNGLEVYTFPFQLAGGQNIFMRTVFEWQPTFTTALMVNSSMFLAFCLVLGLLVISCLDGEVLQDRPGLGQSLGLVGLMVLLILRPQLEGSAWLKSPATLLSHVLGQPALGAWISPVLAPLQWLESLHQNSPWLTLGLGNNPFTLLWGGLLVWILLRWRRPATAVLPMAAVLLMFLFLQAGSHAALVLGLTVLPALVAGVVGHRLQAWQAATLLMFLLLAVRQNRNIVNFALVTLPFLAPALTHTWQSLGRAVPAAPGAPRRPWMRLPFRPQTLQLTFWSGLFLLLSAVTLSWGWPYTPKVVKRSGLGIGERVPVEAVEYVRSAGLHGRVFNKYSYGAYLIHELYPSTQVYMDSRNGVYGKALYKEYLNSLGFESVAASVFARHQFDYVLVDYALHPRPPIDQGLHAFLARSPDWIEVYFDDHSVIYVPRRPNLSSLIARDGYQVIDPAAYHPGWSRGLTARQLTSCETESQRAMQQAPGSIVASLIQADCRVTARHPSAALASLERVLVSQPRHFFALVTAARLARTLGRLEAARAYYHQALSLTPASKPLKQELQSLRQGPQE